VEKLGGWTKSEGAEAALGRPRPRSATGVKLITIRKMVTRNRPTVI